METWTENDYRKTYEKFVKKIYGSGNSAHRSSSKAKSRPESRAQVANFTERIYDYQEQKR